MARAEAPARRRPAAAEDRRARLGTIGIVVAFCLLWEWGARVFFSPLEVVPPSAVIPEMRRTVTDGPFLDDLQVTAYQVSVGFLLALLFGTSIGWAMWRFVWLERALQPYVAALISFPIIIFFPLLIGIFGITNTPYILIGASTATVPLSLATASALAQLPPVLDKLARSLGMTRVQRYRSIYLPSIAPHLMPGIRLAGILAILGVLATQYLLGARGLGFRINDAYFRFDTKGMYAYIVWVVVLAVCIHGVLKAIESRIRRDLS